MKKEDKSYQCLNCETEDFRLTRGYCSKCYPLILRIEKIEKDILPDVLKNIKDNSDFFQEAKKEYIWQIKWRLEIIKDSHTLKDVSAHDLEYRINGTLKLLDGKSLGKINDSIAHYLRDDRARAYVHQLFSKIQLLKPFKVDFYRIYEARKKNI
jgi:hypothetical protein